MTLGPAQLLRGLAVLVFLVGWAVLQGRVPLRDDLLLVSGRSSYEILQKCLMAGVPVVVETPSERDGVATAGHAADIALLNDLAVLRTAPRPATVPLAS